MSNQTLEVNLAKLNRLRVNAGKSELKAWKSDEAQLLHRIADLEGEGFTDALPGADVKAIPKTNDPAVLRTLPSDIEPEPSDKEVTHGQAGMARGLESESQLTNHTRKSIYDQRKKQKGKVTLSDADKKQIKDEAEHRKGKVDAKKDPEKAKRQEKHIADKKAKREAAGKVGKRKEVGKDEITVADIARDLKLDPKIARAKLRRHETKIEGFHTKGQDRWTFPKKHADKIKKILTGG